MASFNFTIAFIFQFINIHIHIESYSHVAIYHAIFFFLLIDIFFNLNLFIVLLIKSKWNRYFFIFFEFSESLKRKFNQLNTWSNLISYTYTYT